MVAGFVLLFKRIVLRQYTSRAKPSIASKPVESSRVSVSSLYFVNAPKSYTAEIALHLGRQLARLQLAARGDGGQLLRADCPPVLEAKPKDRMWARAARLGIHGSSLVASFLSIESVADNEKHACMHGGFRC